MTDAVPDAVADAKLTETKESMTDAVPDAVADAKLTETKESMTDAVPDAVADAKLTETKESMTDAVADVKIIELENQILLKELEQLKKTTHQEIEARLVIMPKDLIPKPGPQKLRIFQTDLVIYEGDKTESSVWDMSSLKLIKIPQADIEIIEIEKPVSSLWDMSSLTQLQVAQPDAIILRSEKHRTSILDGSRKKGLLRANTQEIEEIMSEDSSSHSAIKKAQTVFSEWPEIVEAKLEDDGKPVGGPDLQSQIERL
jgi:chromosome segregation ATPase